MSYLKNDNIFDDELNSQDLNKIEDDKFSLDIMTFKLNENDDEKSSDNERYFIKRSTAATNKNRQDGFINLNNNNGNLYYNIFEEQSNGLIIQDGGENNQTLLFKKIDGKKELNENIEKEKIEKGKDNINKNEFKEKEEEKKQEKMLFDKNKLPPKQYCIDDINKILNSKSKKEIIIKDANLNDLENKMSDEVFSAPKKRNRDKVNEINKERKKCGRKKKDDTNTKSLHTKDSHDNIAKKIKSKINEFLLLFINSIFNSFLTPSQKNSYIRIIKNIPGDKEPKNEDLLKDLDYNKTVNETKKERNLEFLKMPLKDYLSIDISEKYKTYSKNSNKKVIDEILKNEKDNEIIMFILNDLTLGDYIDIFLCKKELKDFGNIGEDKINSIMEKFKRVDALIEGLDQKKNENNYYSNYFYIFYNYERWFFIKIDRKERKKK